MSRGKGRVERAIRALFDTNPDRVFTTEELARQCYPEAVVIAKKHSVAVLRAAHRVVAGDPDWESWALGEGHNAGLLFCNRDSVESMALAYLIGERIEWRRRAGRSRWAMQQRERDDTSNLRAWLYDSPVYRAQMEPGGWWYQMVEMHRARRDGDTVRFEKLRAEQEAEQRRLMGRSQTP